MQQLREGVNNFFATFIEVLCDRTPRSGVEGASSGLMVEPDVTSGDYLHGFFQGTRTALYENGRESMTITVEQVSPRTIGVLIALYERAVGLYAELIDINAYHQPGVEAGKKAATAVIALQHKILAYLRKRHPRHRRTNRQSNRHIRRSRNGLRIILRHLAANPDHAVKHSLSDGTCVETIYGM